MFWVTRCMILTGLAAVIVSCAPSQTASILSSPKDVVVSVNGQRIGTTPIKYDFEFSEDFIRHTVKGAKKGYHSSTVVVSKNRLMNSDRVVLTLESQNKPALITSEPDEVIVKVDGRKIGQTPIEHAFNFSDRSSRYKVTGSKEGYHDSSVTITENGLKRSAKVMLTLESQDKAALFYSEPNAASLSVGDRRLGDREVGRTPVEYTFSFANRSQRYMVTISKPGYFDHVLFVTENSDLFRSGEIDIVLEEDPAWTSTSESEATNRWLRIPVNLLINHASAWQKVIDSVTTVYNSLEQLDQTSGYLRSAPRIRQYDKGPEGPYFVRTQFIGSISSMDPLTYKIKLIAKTRLESDSDENWKDFGRVFAEDAQLVEELLNRLGLK